MYLGNYCKSFHKLITKWCASAQMISKLALFHITRTIFLKLMNPNEKNLPLSLSVSKRLYLTEH